ncbi:MAG: TolC family protein [Verrucomicrobia bacterium]|nr:TolC family protein [Verrucomicrobiota bacterium]
MKRTTILLASALALLTALSGCRGIQTRGERQARQDTHAVAVHYRPDGARPTLPELSPQEGLSNYLTYAMLNSPRVEAAYYNWSAAVERITLERSMPDPQLTFQSDISDVVMTIMPGLMQMFPGPGKLKARANLATAESRTLYFAFESAVLQTAFEFKRSFYELYFLDDRIRINEQNLALLTELEEIARAQNQAGKATLQDVLRAQIERDRLITDLANLEDSRQPKRAAFKASLGLTSQQPDPPVPSQFESTTLQLNDDQLLEIAFERNPQLKAMESEVRTTRAGIAVAYKEEVPDFNLGVMADVKANPIMVRPLAGMTLPIWRDKIAAGIARAKAQELTAQSRLTGEQISLTVLLAEKSFAYRELTRNMALLRNQIIPKAELSVEIARAGYLSGSITFFNLIDAQRQQLALQLEEVQARTQREIVLAELSLLIAGLPPQGAPLLEESEVTE